KLAADSADYTDFNPRNPRLISATHVGLPIVSLRDLHTSQFCALNGSLDESRFPHIRHEFLDQFQLGAISRLDNKRLIVFHEAVGKNAELRTRGIFHVHGTLTIEHKADK